MSMGLLHYTKHQNKKALDIRMWSFLGWTSIEKELIVNQYLLFFCDLMLTQGYILEEEDTRANGVGIKSA